MFRSAAYGWVAFSLAAGALMAPLAWGQGRDGVSVSGRNSAQPAGKLGGRYRVVVEGFTANSESWDHALQVDGKGDEVFVSANVIYRDREEVPLLTDEVSTRTMGDTNGFGERVAAGTANGAGGAGGLVSGNSFPSEPPYVRTVQPSLGRRYPPWVVWEGDLVQGDHALAIAPSVWEWDGGRDAFGDWTHWLQGAATKIGSEVKKYTKGGTVADTVIESATVGLGIAASLYDEGLLGQAQDRPIGMVETVPQTSPRSYTFGPKLLVLNYDRAEALLRTSLLGVAGLRAFEYRDDPRFRGHYTLYLRLEKLGPPTELKPDQQAPRASASARALGQGRVLLRWRGSDPDIARVNRTGVAKFDLRLRRPGAGWVTILRSTTRSNYTVRRRRGARIAYSVRATDRAGNRGSWTRQRVAIVR
jgi:hypothetical protein